jgi:PhzF family phenazine biosynthesis protein
VSSLNVPSLKIWLVDAFTNEPFQGNPAGVCLLPEFLSPELMQTIANELNWSETTFLVQKGPNHFHIRWFSPKDEAPMCGHATLAAAHALWCENPNLPNDLIFDSLSGPLSASKQKDGWITLNFPQKIIEPSTLPDALAKALNQVTVHSVHRDDLLYVVELATPQEVANYVPNFSLIEQVDCRALVITSQGHSPYDFVSRYFAPRVGIPEDPVCGSAHCRLVPYWASRLNKKEMLAYQSSNRGGVLRVRLEENRVFLSGQACTVAVGHFPLPLGETNALDQAA